MSDNTITVNGMTVEFHEMDAAGRINFKLDNTWRDPMDFIVPKVSALDFIMRVHKTGGGFWSREMKDFASNSEVRRWLDNSAIRFNGRALKPKDVIDFPLYSVVLFPKAQRITIL